MPYIYIYMVSTYVQKQAAIRGIHEISGGDCKEAIEQMGGQEDQGASATEPINLLSNYIWLYIRMQSGR